MFGEHSPDAEHDLRTTKILLGMAKLVLGTFLCTLVPEYTISKKFYHIDLLNCKLEFFCIYLQPSHLKILNFWSHEILDIVLKKFSNVSSQFIFNVMLLCLKTIYSSAWSSPYFYKNRTRFTFCFLQLLALTDSMLNLRTSQGGEKHSVIQIDSHVCLISRLGSDGEKMTITD